jgi:hypothetical protein
MRHTKSGKSLHSIGHSADLRQSTVYSIVKGKDKIEDHVQTAGNMQLTIMSNDDKQ